MDFQDTPEEAKFRAQVRAWLAAFAPAHEMPVREKISDEEQVSRGLAWQREVHKAGFAGIMLPRELGGRGGTILEALVYDEEEQHYNLPKGAYVGIAQGMALPVIGRHGEQHQIERFAASTLSGELVWCQLFSEPAAGSDLAAVRTRAVRDGDNWIVNGQKVWSSWAQFADWGILIARTDPDLPKHKGLTFFVLDMKSPGVEVRPIRQLSGASDFNEVFLSDVVVPDVCRIGAKGEGWACCMTVLMGERLNESHHGKVKEFFDYIRRSAPDGSSLQDGQVRMSLAEAYAEEHAERFFQARLRTLISRGENPGALPSMLKLAYANRLQKTAGFAMEIAGYGALAIGSDDAGASAIWEDYIWSSALRIAGGADEVLRNQIAERVLGMPGEMRADKGVPFKDL
ncbi:MAG: acyl-CoA dehydrogenase family protein [Pseudomonadota bacterium]